MQNLSATLPNLTYGRHPGVVDLLKEAVFWIDAEHAQEGEQTAKNLGSGGSVLDARYGSGAGVDTNDPLFLPHSGENYAYFPGVAGNYLSSPDSVPLSITGDLFVYTEVQLDDWSPSTGSNLISKWTASGNQRSWRLQVGSTGFLTLTISTTGADAIASISTVSLNTVLSDGDRKYVGATFDSDNGAGEKSIRFWISEDAITWEELGVAVVSAGAATIFDSTAVIEIGSINLGTAELTSGKIYKSVINSGIGASGIPGGTTVFEFNADTDISTGQETSFVCTSGQTVTVNRATSGRKTCLVTRPVWLFGTDDYLEVADNALLDFPADQDFTVLAILRMWHAPASTRSIIAKGIYGAASHSYSIASLPTQIQTFYAPASPAYFYSQALNPSYTGEIFVASLGRSIASPFSYRNKTSIGTAASGGVLSGAVENVNVLRIGRDSSVGDFCDMEFLSALIFRRSLSADEIAAIVDYYQRMSAPIEGALVDHNGNFITDHDGNYIYDPNY